MLLAIWNCIQEPLDIAFKPEAFSSNTIFYFNWVIDSIFFLDIISNFRTSFSHPLTGDEIVEPKKIVRNYLKGMFWIDFVSVMRFEDFFESMFDSGSNSNFLKALSILKLFRVMRLSKLITYMNSTDDVKNSLKVLKLCFFLILYVHLVGCIWVYINQFNPPGKYWMPIEFLQDNEEGNSVKKTYEDYLKLHWAEQWMHAFHASI